MPAEGYLGFPIGNLVVPGNERLTLPGDTVVVPIHEVEKPLRNLFEKMPAMCAMIMPTRRGESPRRTMDRALTALKLFKMGFVAADCLMSNEGSPKADFLPHYRNYHSRDRYILSEPELSRFLKWWQIGVELSPTDFCVYRYHLADFRPFSQDRFVDQVECLEYLLVPDSGGGEISYKFRTRGAILFGEGDSERDRIHGQLKNLYNIRSSIVHGQQTKVRDWNSEINSAREFARRALVHFAELGLVEKSEGRRKYLVRMSLSGTP